MKKRFDRLKKEIEKDLWIPAIKDHIRLCQLRGQEPEKWVGFLKELEQEAEKRLKETCF